MKTLKEQAEAKLKINEEKNLADSRNKNIIRDNVLRAASRGDKYVSFGSLHLGGDLSVYNDYYYKNYITFSSLTKLQIWLMSEKLSLFVSSTSPSLVNGLYGTKGFWTNFNHCSFKFGIPGVPRADLRISGWV